MKRLLALAAAVCLLLTGCAKEAEPVMPAKKQYTATFLTLFDTVTYIVGLSESEDDFRQEAQVIHDGLLEYHRLFDIYNSYEGINNLKTVNDNAGIAPVKVDIRIIEMLTDCLGYYDITGGSTNVAMGSVLVLWHNARSDALDNPAKAYLPDDAELTEAAQHTDIGAVVIDAEAGTVFITDPDVRLDVGAVAKGWAAQKAAENAPEGMLISIGGNVCATGPKAADGTPWVVGVRDPDGAEDDYLHTLNITGGCVVTSGDYQRGYAVGDRYLHHIIDPETLYPAEYWRSVTVVCEDSGLADALSTALFVMDYESGLAIAEVCCARVMWVAKDGTVYYSPGFEQLIRT